MERRAASHTEEEEMNQRRRLLNAAKKGDQKAVAKLFELYQVRVYNSEMVTKLNRAAGTHKLQSKGAPAKQVKGAVPAKNAHAKGKHQPVKKSAAQPAKDRAAKHKK